MVHEGRMKRTNRWGEERETGKVMDVRRRCKRSILTLEWRKVSGASGAIMNRGASVWTSGGGVNIANCPSRDGWCVRYFYSTNASRVQFRLKIPGETTCSSLTSHKLLSNCRMTTQPGSRVCCPAHRIQFMLMLITYTCLVFVLLFFCDFPDIVQRRCMTCVGCLTN